MPEYPFTIYYWRVFDPLRKRWRTTTFRCTEEQIKGQFERFQRIELGSHQVTAPARGPHSLTDHAG